VGLESTGEKMNIFYMRQNSTTIQSCLVSKTIDFCVGSITTIRYQDVDGFPSFQRLTLLMDKDIKQEGTSSI
jgi:hypothetical protein